MHSDVLYDPAQPSEVHPARILAVVGSMEDLRVFVDVRGRRVSTLEGGRRVETAMDSKREEMDCGCMATQYSAKRDEEVAVSDPFCLSLCLSLTMCQRCGAKAAAGKGRRGGESGIFQHCAESLSSGHPHRRADMCGGGGCEDRGG